MRVKIGNGPWMDAEDQMMLVELTKTEVAALKKAKPKKVTRIGGFPRHLGLTYEQQRNYIASGDDGDNPWGTVDKEGMN